MSRGGSRRGGDRSKFSNPQQVGLDGWAVAGGGLPTSSGRGGWVEAISEPTNDKRRPGSLDLSGTIRSASPAVTTLATARTPQYHILRSSI